MGTSRLFLTAAMAVVLLFDLFTVTASGVSAAQRGGSDACVTISGGTVLNTTDLNVVADGGTSISDAGGGSGNVADPGGNGNNRNRNNNRNNNNNNNNNNRRNRNNWSAEPLDVLETRLLQTETASAGNAGVATSSANGGAVSIGDVNSGGNAGNAISVGDTACPGAARPAGGGGAAPSGGGGGGDRVRALPSTGVGWTEASSSGSLLFALGSLGLAALSLVSRLDRRTSGATSR